MPIGFSVRVDLRGLQLALANVKNGVPRAATRAINRTLVTVRAEAAREIAADIGVPVRQVTPSLPITKATFTTLTGAIVIDDKRRIPLGELNPQGPEPSRGKGQGVSYSLGGSRRRIPTAFLATMKSGHRGVFKRKGTKRLPIQELFGPSIQRVAAKRTILDAVKRLGAATLAKNLQHEVSFLLTGAHQVPTGEE